VHTHRGARDTQRLTDLVIGEPLDNGEVQDRPLARRQLDEQATDVDPGVDRIPRSLDRDAVKGFK
jgi:hypothetical protein